jgi:hypothetical protein
VTLSRQDGWKTCTICGANSVQLELKHTLKLISTCVGQNTLYNFYTTVYHCTGFHDPVAVIQTFILIDKYHFALWTQRKETSTLIMWVFMHEACQWCRTIAQNGYHQSLPTIQCYWTSGEQVIICADRMEHFRLEGDDFIKSDLFVQFSVFMFWITTIDSHNNLHWQLK